MTKKIAMFTAAALVLTAGSAVAATAPAAPVVTLTSHHAALGAQTVSTKKKIKKARLAKKKMAHIAS
jgi:ABC-type glycerol-3-phosphate transport system substrate-binding protein